VIYKKIGSKYGEYNFLKIIIVHQFEIQNDNLEILAITKRKRNTLPWIILILICLGFKLC
jgi:hypothetical protein